MRTGASPERLPVVPDRSFVTARAAAEAVEGILAAGKHARRFGGLEVRAAAETGHAVTFLRTGRSLHTMCVIDALGAGAMCREDAAVLSSCQDCGTPVAVRVGDRGASIQGVQPPDAVVWAGFRATTGSAATSVCKELLPFCSAQHLDRWKGSRPHSDGRALTMEEALQVGKSFFADRALLGPD